MGRVPDADRPKAVKPRPLTTKQRKYVKAKLEGKTGTQAAVEAYGVDEKVASVISSQNLNKLSIQQALEQVYEKRGISLDRMIEPFDVALSANRVVQIEGDFYETDVPDHTTRMSAGKTLAQFVGVGKQPEGGVTNLNFINISRSDKGEYGL